MSAPTIILCAARLDELAVLRAIDEDASGLYAQIGILFEVPDNHPFALEEAECWRQAVSRGRAWLAATHAGEPVGFAACSYVDDEPYLAQLAVRRAYMRAGVGTQLLDAALRWSGAQPLWLTTYGHVTWNRPYYEQRGFVVVPEGACGPELRSILSAQREVLPLPEQRVAMRHPPRTTNPPA